MNYSSYLQSEHWKVKRKEKLLINNKCELCGIDTGLNIHHNSYKNLYNEPLEDLNTLCSSCHSICHKSNATNVRNIVILSKKHINMIRELTATEIQVLFNIYNGVDSIVKKDYSEIKTVKNITNKEKSEALENISKIGMFKLEYDGIEVTAIAYPKYMYNNLEQFIILDKTEMLSFSSKYAAMLCLFARQYYQLGIYLMPINDFRDYFQVPDSYQISVITERILEYGTNEINSKTQFNVKYEKVKTRGKVSHIRFIMKENKE